MTCCTRSEFNKLLDAYVLAVGRGAIRPSPGYNIRDNLLNNDQQFMTVFVPTNSFKDRITTAYEDERYRHSVRRGDDPLLLQKVLIA